MFKDINLTSIENINLNDSTSALTSPRSLLACKQLGIIPGDLHYVSIDQYKQQNPSFVTLSSELLLNRYQHFDKLRCESIRMVKKQRKKIIDEEASKNNSIKSRDISLPSNSKSFDNMIEELMHKEQHAIEKIKARQKNEIQSLIEQEVKLDVIRYRSNEKDSKLQQKGESLKEELLSKSLVMEERRKEKEAKRQSELNLRRQEQMKLNRRKERNEMRRMREIKENENRRKREMSEKSIIEQQKLKECLSIIEKNDEEQTKKVEARRLFIENKYKERQEALEKERLEKLVTLERQKKEYEKRLCQTKSNFDQQLTRMQSNLTEKHKKVQRKIEEANSMRDLSLKRKQEEDDIKRKNILFALCKEEKEKEKTTQKYFAKLDKLDQTIYERDATRRQLIMQRSQSQNGLFLKSIEVRNEKEKEDEKKKREVLTKLHVKHRKVEDDIKLREKENTCKIEEMFNKRYEKAVNIQRIKRKQDFHNEFITEELKFKEKKLEHFNSQKLQLKSTKEKMEESILKEREAILQKFEILKHKKKGIDIDTVERLFPNDKDFTNRIKRLNERKYNYSSTKNSIINSSGATSQFGNSLNISLQISKANTQVKDKGERLSHIVGSDNGNNDTEEKTNGKEEEERRKANLMRKIEKSVEGYKNDLLKEINRVVEEEKIKEKERVRKFELAKEKKEIEKLEKELLSERAVSNQKINELQSQIETKLKEYKAKLFNNPSLIC